MDWAGKIKAKFFFPLFQPSNSLKNSPFLSSFCLSLSRQTNDNFGDFFSNFQIFKAYLGPKSWWNLTWICWKMALKIWPFFSQFVKIFKVSSLDFSKKQSWQNWHIFLTKISQIFEISVISFEYRKRFERKVVENRWTGLLFQQTGLNLWNFWRNLKNHRLAFGKINSQKQWKEVER